MHVVLSVGSNIGDRTAHLRSAVNGFSEEIVGVSPLYQTPPWGGVDQDDFYNAVLLLETQRSPEEILRHGQSLEREAARSRVQHWGPRTLDVDIVTCVRNGHEVRSRTPELLLPHPYAHQRAFVLIPWVALVPNATLGGRAISELVAELDTQDISLVAKEWV
ncbi:2-amino-4-hydroxy-6-hydroxymethyldihydropteridine diphosphokinase [Corynebacterium freiburgense]|uniref:2-amino-4-hydroxy-6- hydroxymethyldihydropteridine diphosphokinase n=1 Tax=Corynebacterium freiburgense TaxID=556548 RepID=UPI00040F7C20|nr:2-amino-4-hydroxy-6-hydroxymethyldihydropteridine diphosphokinase [Corynebacterium freiburgense]WJZ03687.1 2-amino-4-hydroxy-6-hydroxymethyldihydropteridine pyrophosphokinase [Corynebacterium freiburgense]